MRRSRYGAGSRNYRVISSINVPKQNAHGDWWKRKSTQRLHFAFFLLRPTVRICLRRRRRYTGVAGRHTRARNKCLAPCDLTGRRSGLQIFVRFVLVILNFVLLFSLTRPSTTRRVFLRTARVDDPPPAADRRHRHSCARVRRSSDPGRHGENGGGCGGGSRPRLPPTNIPICRLCASIARAHVLFSRSVM